MTRPTISRHMTRALHTIGIDQSLATAHRFMREHHIRHLPVLADGALVGIVSLRDLNFIEAIAGVDPNTVTVEDAMTPDPYVVGPNEPLEDVAAVMAERKLGSAIVVEEGRVAGIFTTVDALGALVVALETPRTTRRARAR